jgi:hypothetical protein
MKLSQHAKLILLAIAALMDQSKGNEELLENSVVDFNGSHVHDGVRGGQAKLQGHGQELSDEQGQGLQLRQRLRLR